MLHQLLRQPTPPSHIPLYRPLEQPDPFVFVEAYSFLPMEQLPWRWAMLSAVVRLDRRLHFWPAPMAWFGR